MKISDLLNPAPEQPSGSNNSGQPGRTSGGSGQPSGTSTAPDRVPSSSRPEGSNNTSGQANITSSQTNPRGEISTRPRPTGNQRYATTGERTPQGLIRQTIAPTPLGDRPLHRVPDTSGIGARGYSPLLSNQPYASALADELEKTTITHNRGLPNLDEHSRDFLNKFMHYNFPGRR
jgi:hypothetical protein